MNFEGMHPGRFACRRIGLRPGKECSMEFRRILCLALLSLCAAGAANTFARPRQRPLGTGISSVMAGVQPSKQTASPECREWTGQVCTVCGIETPIDISLKNRTKTPVLLCSDMKPGPARVEMTAHAEPTIPGLWEVELGLGYRT